MYTCLKLTPMYVRKCVGVLSRILWVKGIGKPTGNIPIYLDQYIDTFFCKHGQQIFCFWHARDSCQYHNPFIKRYALLLSHYMWFWYVYLDKRIGVCFSNSFLIVSQYPIKFRYCEKAQNLKKIFQCFLESISNVKTKWVIFSNFCDHLRISEL